MVPAACSSRTRASSSATPAGIQLDEGFVEEGHGGLLEEETRQGQPPPHPGGVGAHRPVVGRGQPEALQGSSRGGEGLAEEPGQEGHVLEPREVLVDEVGVAQEPDLGAHCVRLAPGVGPEDLHRPGGGPDGGGQNAEQGGLPRAVVTGQEERRAPAEGEREPNQRPLRPVAFADLVQLQGGRSSTGSEGVNCPKSAAKASRPRAMGAHRRCHAGVLTADPRCEANLPGIQGWLAGTRAAIGALGEGGRG